MTLDCPLGPVSPNPPRVRLGWTTCAGAVVPVLYMAASQGRWSVSRSDGGGWLMRTVGTMMASQLRAS